jgi:tyrosinase
MKLCIPLCGGILIASITVAQTFSTSGVRNGVDPTSGARPFRQDIEIFQHTGPAWDLYIQALQTYMKMDSSELLSYFQVAGEVLSSQGA